MQSCCFIFINYAFPNSLAEISKFKKLQLFKFIFVGKSLLIINGAINP